MKKNICLAIVLALSLSLTACGGASSGSSPAEPESATTQETASTGEDYAGEGAVQGGIPTDEELAERNQEASSTEEASSTDSLDSEEEPDYSDANVEMSETPTSSDTFISSDNFWQGEDYFDLEEYLYMNGCDKIRYLTDNGPVENPPEKKLPALALMGRWQLSISASNCILTDYDEYVETKGNPTREYYIYLEFTNEAPSVRVNNDEAVIMKNMPELLDQIIICLHEHESSDNPLESSSLEYSSK
ncbi:hypothetical protein IJ798_00050 [Candidatus Saccharibacteria bacterium]|nr:hypothetical protein [Candidatus Saccharibacteria bacterium]